MQVTLRHIIILHQVGPHNHLHGEEIVGSHLTADTDPTTGKQVIVYPNPMGRFSFDIPEGGFIEIRYARPEDLQWSVEDRLALVV